MDEKAPGRATPLSATALVLQDGTIVSLAVERPERRSYVRVAAAFLRTAWREMALGALAGILVGFALLWLLPRSWVAQTVIEPSPVAQSLDQEGRLTNLVSGGIRGLLGSEGALPQMTKDFLQLLDSNAVAATLLKDPRVKAEAFADQWDSATGTYHPPTGLRYLITRSIKSLLGMPAWHPPGPEEMRRYLGMHLTIAPIGDGTLQQLSMRTSNAEWSAYLLNKAVKAADQYLRNREALRSRASIDYWQKQMNSTTAQDLRSALIANIVDAQRRVVFAGIDLPFAVDISDPIIVPRIPAGPSPMKVMLGSILGGILLSQLPRLWRAGLRFWNRARNSGS
jgi:hypothetical protein